MSVNYCSDRPSTAQLEALYSGVGWSLYLAPGLLDACLDGSLWFESTWTSSDAESSSGEEPPEGPGGRVGASPTVEQDEGSGMSPREGPGAGSGGDDGSSTSCGSSTTTSPSPASRTCSSPPAGSAAASAPA